MSLISEKILNDTQYKITKPIRLIELFAGYGSQAMALRNIDADFEHYKVVEIDDYCIKSYNAVHNTNFIPQDITKIHSVDLEIVDKDKYEYIMTYSWPCQDVSTAGLSKGLAEGSGTRSSLLWECKRILSELRDSDSLPQVLLMENVPGLLTKKFIPQFDKWLQFLTDMGYKTVYDVLDSSDYGIPQQRKRVFALSLLRTKKQYNMPNPIPLKHHLTDLLESDVDDKYYVYGDRQRSKIEDLIRKSKISYEDIYMSKSMVGRYGELSPTILATYYKRGFNQIGNTSTGFNTIGVLESEKIKCLGNYNDESGGNGYPNGRIYSVNGLSPTINTCAGGDTQPTIVESCRVDNYNKEHDFNGVVVCAMRGRDIANPSNRKLGATYEQRLEIKDTLIANTITSVQKDNLLLDLFCLRLRKLTSRECLRLQGVRDSDIDKMYKVNSDAQLYKQAGNSITVDVLEALFKQML